MHGNGLTFLQVLAGVTGPIGKHLTKTFLFKKEFYFQCRKNSQEFKAKPRSLREGFQEVAPPSATFKIFTLQNALTSSSGSGASVQIASKSLLSWPFA